MRKALDLEIQVQRRATGLCELLLKPMEDALSIEVCCLS